MERLILFLMIGLSHLLFFDASAQGIHAHHEIEKDTNDLKHFLKKGNFYGHARSYMSSTMNDGNLSDYHAWGLGAGIGYETPKFLNHFQVALSGFFMFNMVSSDLQKPDAATGQLNRYEIGLFDIEKPSDHSDLDRLEELNLKIYLTNKSKFTIGRQIPASPFINPQDGRMRPTLIEAAVFDLKESEHLSLHGEYIWRISPRSTTRWFEIGESVGVYPTGLGTDGKPSSYKGRISSTGVGVVGVLYQKKKWIIQFWNTYVGNVSNTAFVKMERKSKVRANKNWFFGGQGLYQSAIGNGGNAYQLDAYISKNAKSMVFSGRIGQQAEKFDWFFNATRITASARYLMPREWGREPFYTFMPRERNEGFGDVSAFTINTYFKPQKHIKLELSGGYFRLPDIKNVVLNKYSMPTYSQLNVGLSYQFRRYFKGLNLLGLVVRKEELGETYQNSKYVFNKVNMTHLNLILNYYY
jgi:hypothetical protein